MANQIKQKAGSLGGRATVAKYGRDHMVEIGRRGAATLWARYSLYPFELAKYALVNRSTGEIRAVR